MPEQKKSKDFIRQIIEADIESGKWDGRVETRFPPEPNGYLHIGHAKAFCLNFGVASEYGGVCHLRFDDTNPIKEEKRYINAIQEDIRWMGFDWGEHQYHASDYFEQLYEWAIKLIKAGKAYVDDQTAEQIRVNRGTLTKPGKNSPYRDRSVDENLHLFAKMRAGEFEEGEKTLRAKINMSSDNINLRDPVMYRILKKPHPRTGDKWCIYPTYDWAHGQSDSIENITHSLCSLEFENHRPLYDWFLDQLGEHHPQQIEFARLNLTFTVMSKRKLLELVEGGYVDGWDDPRMPTISGMRNRGYSPEAIRDFLSRIGVAKTDSTVDMALLEHVLREHLNKASERRMAVLQPLKVTITNYPDGGFEELEAINNPEDESAGNRSVPFSRTIYIERDDFMEDPPRKFYRLAPGREVRLRYAYFITCNEVIKDDDGNVTELLCAYDPETRGGDAPDGRRPKATLHWVCASNGISATVNLYDRLFDRENPFEVEGDGDWKDNICSKSLTVIENAVVEPSLASARPLQRYQFERKGYFCVDRASTSDRPVFNRTISLRDTWAKLKKRANQQKNNKKK